MTRNTVSVMVAITMLGTTLLGNVPQGMISSNMGNSFIFGKWFHHGPSVPGRPSQTTTVKETTEQRTTEQRTTEEVTTEEATTEKETTTEQRTTEEATTEEITTEKETTTLSDEDQKHNEELYNDIYKYKELASKEAEWLWSQQMSNGALAFYNEQNGQVSINPYFSEIVAIALINHDSSDTAKKNIERYFDWHMSHLNTAQTDYNGVAGTIYDYTAVVKDGVVVSETSKNSYDSTDSYSALFVKALADYVKVYGDTTYLEKEKQNIRDIVNVMFATMSGGYTYAKPDYKIRYLMDNSEVYAGLVSAKYIYENVIDDNDMYEKVSDAVKFYDEHFNEHWWMGDHYATVLNDDYSEYNGYSFSWDMLYPCASSEIYPVIYGIVDADSIYAKTVYEGFCKAWNWQDMDYIAKGETVFCWGSFSYMGGIMDDKMRLDSYMGKYEDIVDAGRKYPLYSSESAMVLGACDGMANQLRAQVKR